MQMGLVTLVASTARLAGQLKGGLAEEKMTASVTIKNLNYLT